MDTTKTNDVVELTKLSLTTFLNIGQMSRYRYLYTLGKEFQNDILEESLLMAVDALKDQAKDQATKMLADLFKSAVLKKYKDAFDEELSKGEVQKKNIDKSVEFCYSDICVTIRQFPTMQDDEKDDFIQKGKEMIPTIKGVVTQVLLNNGIKIIS